MRAINRIRPQGPPSLYKTYEISAPVSTHTRPATCVEVECEHYFSGWRTEIDVTTEQGRSLADYLIGRTHGRAFTQERTEGGLAAFVFPAGQRCFRASQHRVPLDREPDYRILTGDHRQTFGATHHDAGTWLADFGEHQERTADLLRRG